MNPPSSGMTATKLSSQASASSLPGAVVLLLLKGCAAMVATMKNGRELGQGDECDSQPQPCHVAAHRQFAGSLAASRPMVMPAGP